MTTNMQNIKYTIKKSKCKPCFLAIFILIIKTLICFWSENTFAQKLEKKI